MSKSRIVGAVIAVFVVIYAALSATVVKEGQEATLTGEVAFDPTTVATKFWEEKSAEYFEANAVDLAQLLTEANGDTKITKTKLNGLKYQLHFTT